MNDHKYRPSPEEFVQFTKDYLIVSEGWDMEKPGDLARQEALLRLFRHANHNGRMQAMLGEDFPEGNNPYA